ncbi:MAG TPA: aminotransferase class V-fold PLP-dependent enzyme [Chryseosolibacter sp.]|nr:aminotransferase class V-fold PLP-dependent enzyme [Chryseosolibacter sp.]
MISFYPGPSRVHGKVPRYVKDAYKDGILSINHRSEEFMKMSERTIHLLKSRLEIPHDYTVFYTSSATECWEIITQSVVNASSYHIHNGAFGSKWFEYAKRIRPGAKSFPFDHNALIDPKKLRPGKEEAVICLTQNETSNGTQVSMETMHAIRAAFPNHLIAVDATSSMAGIYLDFNAADIWLASVQKCFGLPAGLGLLICSPAAMERAKRSGERDHYNSLVFMASMMEKWQTPYTPNVLGIYLLMRVLADSKPIREVHKKIANRYRHWAEFLRDRQSIKHFISNEEARSLTVVPVEAKETLVTSIKARAKKSGILLGEGYGDWKSSTFRIANFPAIRKKEIKTLQDFLTEY